MTSAEKPIRGPSLDKRTKQLLGSFTIERMTLKDRLAGAPMTRARAGAERFSRVWKAAYYAQRAGASLLIAEFLQDFTSRI